jgi:ABC-type antimicrobial peptide transport system permease subunit
MISLNFKLAIRNLLRNFGFSLINIGGLSIGFACCLMLLLYVNYEWGFNKEFKDIDRIYFAELNLDINGERLTLEASPVKLGPTASQEIHAIEFASRMSDDLQTKLFTYKENKLKLRFLNVDPSFLKIFDYRFIQGNPETALNEPNAVLITESTARRLFGSQNPIGQSLKWDNRELLKVTAVIKDLSKNQSFQFDALQTFAFLEKENPYLKTSGWESIECSTIFKLKAASDFNAADTSLRRLIKNHHKGSLMEAFLFPFSKYHLYNEFKNGKPVGGKIDQLKLFVFLAFCVLLIASINYMNLSTARSEKRAKEVGVRKALGSSRSALMNQFLAESMLLSVIAMALAIALLELSLPYFNNLLSISIEIDYRSYLYWLTPIVLILLTGILAGSYPSFYLSSFTPICVLKKNTSFGKSSLPVRKILVVFQFSLSICMIICAIVIYTQIRYMKNKPLGFRQDNLVELPLEGELRSPGKLEIFKNTLKAAGAITSATEYVGAFTRPGGNVTGDLSWPGKPVNEDFVIHYRSIGFNFSETIGAKVLLGRDLSPKFPADTTSSILINQAGLNVMKIKDPVDKVIRWGDQKVRIVGVLQDYNNASLGRKPEFTIFYYNRKENQSLLLRLDPSRSAQASIQVIKNTSQQLNPAYPVDLHFISEAMENKLESERTLGILSNLFGFFAILISCLGLLGLALFMAEQRNKEISIRKVLGADVQSILILLNRDFMKLVLLSNFVACPAAYMLSQHWLERYDYRVVPVIWPYLTAAFLSILIALLTISIQSFRIAKANAVDALKYE